MNLFKEYFKSYIPSWHHYRSYLSMVKSHEQLCQECGFEIASIKKLKNFKKTNKLFVLGSGSSINQLTYRQWEHISNYDSVGINRWFYHDFCPTFYILDPPRDHESNVGEIMIQGLLYRKEIYSQNPLTIIFPFGCNNRNVFIKNLKDNRIKFQLALSPNIESTTPEQLKLSLQNLQKSYIFNIPDLFWTKTASLDWILLTAMRMGYSEVIFCGVDLNDTLYFYETELSWARNAGLRVPPSLQQGNIHKTFDPEKCFGKIPINQVLLIYLKELVKKFDLKCFIANKSSGLYPDLPAYNWPNQLN